MNQPDESRTSVVVVPCEYPLPDLRPQIADIDITETGGWVGASRTGMEQHLYFNAAAVPVPERIRFPLVRAIDDERVVLVETRTQREVPNAWVMNVRGDVLAHGGADALSPSRSARVSCRI